MPPLRRLAPALAAVLALSACSTGTNSDEPLPGVGGGQTAAPAPNEGRQNLDNPDAGATGGG